MSWVGWAGVCCLHETGESLQMWSLRPSLFAGGDRVLLPRHLHCGGGAEDHGPRLCPPSRQLPQERVEHHGLHCRRHWVSHLHVFGVKKNPLFEGGLLVLYRDSRDSRAASGRFPLPFVRPSVHPFLRSFILLLPFFVLGPRQSSSMRDK